MANPNDQAKLKKRLEALVKLVDNQTCADCRKRGPRWASANLGIFICIECSGIHRNLGVHISFVRSVNLDTWTKAQVDFMEEWGNKRANDYFEGNMPASVIRPKEGDPVRVVERFIRDKYEHRRYIASSVPPKSAPAEAAVETAPAPAPRRVSAVATPAAVAPVAARPTVATAPAPVSAPKQDVPDLLNLMDDPIPAAAPAASVQSAAAGFGSADFGDFTSVTTGVAPAHQQQHTFSAFDSPVKAAAPAQSAASTDFMDFMAAPAAPAAPAPVPGAFPPAAPAVPAKPQASADAILSLYASNQPPRGGPMMGGPMMMGGPQGMYPTHMGHINAQNPHPPMMHHHQQQMGGMPMGQPPVNPFMMQQQMPGRGPAPMQYGGAPPVNPFQQQQQQHMQPMGQHMGGMPGAYPGQQPQQMAPPNPFGGLGLPQHHQQQPGGFQSTMPGQGWR